MVVVKEGFFRKGSAFLVQNEKAVKLITFLIFIGLTFAVGFFHEPWADEAQSWLIARDTDINRLFRVMAYEGSPVLWPMVIKIFIFFGLPYRFIFLIPFLFASLGVWLLIYKSKIPIVFAMVLPFTYYLFYQYAVIARSYCLILPCIELIVIAFPKRIRNPYVYGLLLIFLSGICIHTALLSGVLFLLFCFDIIKGMKQQVNKRQTIQAVAAALIIMFSYLCTIWYLRTPYDSSFEANFNFNIKKILMNLIDLLGNLFIFNLKTVINLIIGIIVIAIFLLLYKVSVQFLIISSSIWVFLSVFYYNQWHIGTIFMSILLAYQLFSPKSREFKAPHSARMGKYKIYSNIIIGMFLCIQFVWSANTAIYDIKNSYTGAYAAAKFIKENGYDKERIYGLGYNATALEPYFDSNIFDNKKQNTSYYIWRENNGDLTNDLILNDLPSVVVLSGFDKEDFTEIEDLLNELGYGCHPFDGASFIKEDIYESQSYYVYVK